TFPLCTERGAPQFDNSSRDTIERYFDNLERLFGMHSIIASVVKKLAAIDYPPATVAKQWKSLPKYSDVSKTYDDFKEEVLSFYLRTDTAYTWTLCEYNESIGENLRTGVQTLNTYMKFYGKFYPIYRYLHSKAEPELTERNASTALLRLVPQQAARSVAARLAQKVPNKHSEEAYTVAQVHEAIAYCMADGGLYGGLEPWVSAPMANLATANPPAPVEFVRNFLSQQCMQASQPPPFQPQYQQQAQGLPPGRFQQTQPGMYAARTPQNDNCIYCGLLGCRLCSCPSVAEDMTGGLIHKNTFNKIILPGGGVVPRNLLGTCMCDRVNAWHEQNPNQKARGTLSNMVGLNPHESQLTLEEEFEVLMAKATMIQDRFDPRKRQVFDGDELEMRPRHTTRNSEKACVSAPERDSPPHMKTNEKEQPKKTDKEKNTQEKGKDSEAGRAKREKVASIVDPAAEECIFHRSFGESNSVTVSAVKLLSMSPGLRRRIHEAMASDENENDFAPANAPDIPPGTGIPVSCSRKRTIVARESEKLCSLFCWVARTNQPTECTLDGGSMIIGCSDKTAYRLKIPYDPTKARWMTSTSWDETMTLGLALNVPIELGGGIVVYVQMHVVRDAPYEILLGRPFSLVMSLKSTSAIDGQETVTVACPNSGRKLTLPT
ncbi:hypothetical protein C8Q80DRAFT_1079889, partial [Daedaleopsis nitida]